MSPHAQGYADNAAKAASDAATSISNVDAAAADAEKTAAAAEDDQRAREAAAREAEAKSAAGQTIGTDDKANLLAACGQTCVDQYWADLTLTGTDLTTFIAQNGGQLLLDVIGVNDLEKCFSQADVEACLRSVGDAVTLALPVLKLWEVPEIMAKIAEIEPKVAKFLDDVRKAKKDLQRLRDLIEAQKKAQELADQLKNGCRDSNGKSWIKYQAVGGLGRATGASACLDKAMVDAGTGSEVSSSVYDLVPGYRWAQRYAAMQGLPPRSTINACHLIGKQLGGEGDTVANLGTCSRAVNQNPMSPLDPGLPVSMFDLEEKVKAAADANEVILYQVTPTYSGNHLVPDSFEMKAQCTASCGSTPLSFDVNIQNLLWSRAQNGWIPLGSQSPNGK